MKESTILILLGTLLSSINMLINAPTLAGAALVILAIGLAKHWATK